MVRKHCALLRSKRLAGGFTLVELLVVITIIGILVALLLPAVSAARESARRTVCQNNLKQLANACLQHDQAQGFLPSGGYGWNWAGDPDRGFGRRQPGGWHYNILPYMDQQALHDQGSDPANDITFSTLKLNGITATMQTPLPAFTCPTRHQVMVFPYTHGNAFFDSNNPPTIARSDYAANAGDVNPTIPEGPGSLSAQAATVGSITQDSLTATGVSYCQSEVRIAQITDGASNTYLVGERYMDPDNYLNGSECANDQGWNQGYDYDTFRWTGMAPNSTSPTQALYTPSPNPPMPDTPGIGGCDSAFGSNHNDVFSMSFCDGSVRPVTFGISPALHQVLGNRQDAQPANTSQF